MFARSTTPSPQGVRLQNQLEALLEEARIKLTSVISDLLGVSGRRILQALAEGETDPSKLAELGDDRLKCSQEELVDALQGRPEPVHRELLKLYLERVQLLDNQIGQLDQMAAKALKQHEDAVIRLAQAPGFGADSAQQVIAEVGADAKSFPQQPSSLPGSAPVLAARKARRRITVPDPQKGTGICGGS
jgi:transposase